MKNLFLALLITCSIVITIPIEAQASNEKYISTKAGLRLRTSPDKSSKVLILIPFGEKVTILKEEESEITIDGKNGKWVNIQYSDKTGWAFSGFLSDENPSTIVLNNNTQIRDNDIVWLMKPQFDAAEIFSEGLARIKQKGKWGFIDKKGNIVIKPQFDEEFDFNEGLAAAKKNGQWGFLDKNGIFVIEPQFDKRTAELIFSEGMSHIIINGKYGFFDKKGNIVIEPQFDYADQFSEGLAPVEKNGKFGFIDKTGNFIIKPQFDYASFFSEGMSRIRKNGKSGIEHKYGLIDKSGNIVVDPQYNNENFTMIFSEGLAKVNKNGKWGYIDKKGNIVIEFQYSEANDFSEGLASIVKDNKFGFIDKKGNVVIEAKSYITNVSYFKEGIALVNFGETMVKNKWQGITWGFIDRKGNLLFKSQFEDVRNFSEGLAAVKKNGKWGFIKNPLTIGK